MTGYHRLAEAALYRRNGGFGNINPFPEEEVVVVKQWKEEERRHMKTKGLDTTQR